MTGFYTSLASVYDIVFPENRAATRFLADCLDRPGRILDLACGTGTSALALARRGHEVSAVDLDETMIAKAREKDDSGTVAFFVGSFSDIETLFPGGGFDLVYSIGNSIPHLSSRNDVACFVTAVSKLLAPGGLFVLQIVNFDRILHYNIDALPPIERLDHDITLVRNYRMRDDRLRVAFDTVLTVGGETTRHSVDLLTLTSGELVSMLSMAGFERINLFGGYDRSPFTVDSPAIVMKGTKGADSSDTGRSY